MPVLTPTFHPPRFLRSGHLQTILPVIWPRRFPQAADEEVLDLPDGDFLGLRWWRGGHRRLAILCHGLEGSAEAGYNQGMAAAMTAAGWDVLGWSYRGCGPRPNRLLRFYHSGATTDLDAVVRHAAPGYPEGIGLIGFSLGGNLALKYAGESEPPPAILGVVAISAPVDLAASARSLDRRWDNRIYLRRFLQTLIAKVEAKALAFPGEIDTADIRRIRSFQEFDDRYTSRLHGFRDAADYWARSSARQFLPRITIPALLLNAQDDPFLPPECFPLTEAEESTHFFLEAPRHGGHVGFIDLAEGRGRTWAERRTVDFLNNATAKTTGEDQPARAVPVHR